MGRQVERQTLLRCEGRWNLLWLRVSWMIRMLVLIMSPVPVLWSRKLDLELYHYRYIPAPC